LRKPEDLSGASGSTRRITDQLAAFLKGYRPVFGGKRMERVKGIEPSSSAWKAVALPLSYTRMGNP
jgi:hypothetical protein